MIKSFRLVVMYNIDIRIIPSQAHGHGIGLYIYREIFLKLVVTYYYNRKIVPVAYIFQDPNNKTIKLTEPELNDKP